MVYCAAFGCYNDSKKEKKKFVTTDFLSLSISVKHSKLRLYTEKVIVKRGY